MKKTKTTYICLIFAIIFTAIPVITAGPIGGSNENYDYLMGGTDFSKFSMGFYSKERNVLVGLPEYGGALRSMEMKKMSGYVGYDVFRWATLYMVGGTTDTKFVRVTGPYSPVEYNGAEGETGFGLQFNLVDHDIADPSLHEDRIRINAGIEYTRSKADWAFRDRPTRWDEIYASMTFSLINQIHGTKLYWPNAIAFFGGPIYSHIESSSLEHDGETGFNIGLAVMYSENVTFNFALESLEKDGFVIGGDIRF